MMQAMNGYSAARRHIRLLGVLVALLAVAAVGMPQGASAEKAKKEPNSVYVALGDSLAFGYSQKLLNENQKAGDPATAFEHGYVQDYYHANDQNGKLALVNEGCPGETTESLIGSNPTFIAKLNTDAASVIKQPITGEAPCAYHELEHLPLHNEYGGAGKSQLENALETIAKDETAGKKVKAITLNIGPNDILHYVGKLEAEAKAKGKEKVEAQAKKEVEEYFGAHGGALEKELGEKDGATYEGEHLAEIGKLEKEDGEKDGATYEGEHPAEIGKLEKEDGEKDGATYEGEHAGAILKLEKEFTEKDGNVYFEEHFEEIDAKVTAWESEATEKGDDEAEAVAYAEAKFEEFIVATVGPQVAKEIEAFIAGQVAPQVTKEIEAFITAQVTPQVTNEIEAFITAQVTPQVTKEIEAFITAQVTPQVTKEVEAALAKLGKEDGEKYGAEHAKALEAEGFAYVEKEILSHYKELFAQVLTNVSGIVTELKKAAPKAKIIYQELYDPYGSVLKAGEELKPGFLALAGVFNSQATTLLTNKKTFKLCVSDPLTLFNPGGATEPSRLQAFTNMANTEVFEGKKDGPDIHPTPFGYEELALQMEARCKF